MAEDAAEIETGAVDVAFQHTSEKGDEFRTWFRGEHTNFNPKLDQIMDVEGPERFVLHGWLPDAPLIGKSTQITAFGSCFAANISNWHLWFIHGARRPRGAFGCRQQQPAGSMGQAAQQ